MIATETEAEAATAAPPVKMKRHIVRRATSGGHAQETLCGAPWDRLHPVSGEMCPPCVEEYKADSTGMAAPQGCVLSGIWLKAEIPLASLANKSVPVGSPMLVVANALGGNVRVQVPLGLGQDAGVISFEVNSKALAKAISCAEEANRL